MSWRVWLFRAIVVAGCVALGAGGYTVYLQTNSTAIKAKVIEQIHLDFPGIQIEIGSLWIRPLGGLTLRDVRLCRRDDPSHPFLIAPTAIVYHDKEQLTEGRLAIRKVELVDPLVKIRRNADGNWNLPALPRPTPGRPETPAPMLVVRGGELQFEDRIGGQARPLLEVRGVQLTIINDPLPRISFHGQGQTVLGQIKWNGSQNRATQAFALTIDVSTYSLSPRVIEQLGGHIPEVRQHLVGLEGQGDAKLDLRHQPGNGETVHYDLQLNLRRGKFHHSRVPLSPLQDIELSARYRDGIVSIQGGRARSGATNVTLELEASLPLEGARSEDPKQLINRFHLGIDHLTLSGDLFDQLPENLKQIHRDFKPNGPIGLTFKFERRDRWWSQRCIVQPEGISAEYVDFPFQISGIRGKLEQVTASDGTDELQIGLSGQSGGRTITIEGASSGSGDRSRLDLKIQGRGIPLDENLKRALGEHRAAAEAFHPVGTGDFIARLRRNPGDGRTTSHIDVDLRDISLCYDEFPYPLKHVNGTLRIHLGAEKKITFDQFQGIHQGGEIGIDGTRMITPTGSVLRLRIRAAGLPVDADLSTALARAKLQSLITTLRPSGRVGLSGELVQTEWNAPPQAPKPPSRVEFACYEFTSEAALPEFLPYELTDIRGSLHFADDRVTMPTFVAKHRGSRLKMGSRESPSVFVIKPAGGLWARFQQLSLVPLVPDEELLCALPPQLRSAVAAMEPNGPMTLTIDQFIIDTTADPAEPSRANFAAGDRRGVRLSSAGLKEDTSSPWMYWDGVLIRMSGASIKMGLKCENVHGLISTRGEYRNGKLGAIDGNVVVDRADIQRQPLQDLHAHLVLDPARAPGVLQMKNIKARVFGGQLAGEIALMLEPVFRYDIRFNAVGVKLEEIDRYNKLTPNADLSGRVEAHLFVAGQGADLANLRGGGLVRVPKGRIYDLPPLLDLLKFLKLRAPDGTFFEEALAKFRIEGETVRFEQIDLLGNLIGLTGEGEMKLDGSNIRLDIYTIWSRLVQLMPGPAREIPNSLSRNLYKIEARGSLGGKLEFRSQAIPFLVEPIRRLMNMDRFK